MIEITEEALKKENLSIESYAKQLDCFMKKIIDLKDVIMIETDKINKLYEKIDSEVTKSYQTKHENLLKEEENLKQILKTEVTKIKEKLENIFIRFKRKN